MSLKSFRDARKAFATNLNSILSKLNYTPASLSMKLNNAAQMGGSVKSVISASDVQDWTSGKKVPSLYAYFKLCDYLHLNMDELLDPSFAIATVVGRSFANQSAATPKISCPVVPEITAEDIRDMEQMASFNKVPLTDIVFPYKETVYNTLVDEFEMLKPYTPPVVKAKPVKVPSVGVVKNAATLHKSLVEKHTTSTNYNSKLAYAVLTSNITVKEVARLIGVAPSTLKDWMYYGVSVPEGAGKKLLKVLHVGNYAALGLKFDTVKTRFAHV